MSFDPVIGRRTLLRLGGMSAGLLTISRLPLAGPAHAAIGASSTGLRVLTPADARILQAIAERMVATGDRTMPRFADTTGLMTIDTALRQLPEETREQLSWALLLFQYGPPFFAVGLSTFTGLPEADQDRYLAGWADSRFQTPRLAFRAFKNLSMLGYYSQDATWKNIHYDGPWAPRPRRALSPEP